MKQIAIAPPPLPPKMRRSPPERTATVLADSQENHHQSHVVKIRINPTKSEIASVTCDVAPRISISVNSEGDMIQKSNAMEVEGERNPYFFFGSYNCNVMSSGQVSPSDTLDSGTCSDLDGTPPPLPKKKGNGITVTVINGHHKRVTSSTSSGVDLDSDDNESSISYDSLNSGELHQDAAVVSLTSAVAATTIKPQESSGGGLPQGLLHDIRQRNVKLSPTETVLKTSVETTNTKTTSPTKTVIVDESTYEERKEKEKQDMCVSSLTYDTDCYYNFHLNENQEEEEVAPVTLNENETFAGYKDLLSDGSSTIRSAKGTVRGVKNRVRAGIATFLQINSVTKNYRDAGKVVVYTTTMGILRDTYQACTKVKQILRTLLVKYEERDVFMSSEYQAEIRERMRCDCILVPQVFVDGQHVGDVETIERLNETGELRRILKPYKSMDVCTTCKMCGGYRLLPCTICNGSKKSVHRNHFTTEFVALKCMNCDEVGLVRCNVCS